MDTQEANFTYSILYSTLYSKYKYWDESEMAETRHNIFKDLIIEDKCRVLSIVFKPQENI